MTNRTFLVAAVAALSLSACNQNQEPEVVGGPVDPMANEIANAAPAPMLPSIVATKKYRCNPGNELVSIDWTELNGAPATANLRVGDAAAPTVLNAAADGKGFSGPDGTSLTGAKDAASVTLTLPGKGELSCKA